MVRGILQTLDLLLIVLWAILMPIRALYPKVYPVMDSYFVPIFVLGLADLFLVPAKKLYGDSEDGRMLLRIRSAAYPISFFLTILVATVRMFW